MLIDKKFKIDTVLLEVLEKKDIGFREILKNTMQFITMINWYIKKDTEAILLEIIEQYKNYTLIPLSKKYKAKTTFLTQEQSITYNTIYPESRTKIMNELISIAINNSNYINVTNKKLEVKKDILINQTTLDYFLSFDKNNQEFIICMMKSLLFKLGRVKNNSLLVESFYAELLCNIFKENDDNADELLLNVYENNFLYEEFGKIFFVMNIMYNMSLKNESKSYRKWKSKYEPILERKYQNNLNDFIKNEINLSKMDKTKELEELFYFMNEMHPQFKEREVFKISWNLFIQNNPKFNKVFIDLFKLSVS
jgi:hypothetical protein